MQGRPQLFPHSKQISVLVSSDDYKVLGGLVEKARVARPGYSFGDLLRDFIRRVLDQEPDLSKPLKKLPPGKDRIRRLYAIARQAQRLARELDKK